MNHHLQMLKQCLVEYNRDTSYFLLTMRMNMAYSNWDIATMTQEGNMLAVFMVNALEAVGIVVSIAAVLKALRWGASQRTLRGYETPMDMANDSEIWCRAVEYQRESSVGK